MRIPESVIAEISNKADILTVIGGYVQLINKGGRFWARCPFHGEKTPSFTVTPEKGVYYCFGCHKGGTVFNFIMEIEKVTFEEAAKILAKLSGVTLSYTGDAKQDSDREILLDLYKKVSNMFHYILLNKEDGMTARNYLIKRGLTQETINEFQLGYAPADRQWLSRFLMKKNYSKEFLFKSGFFSTKTDKLSAFFYDRVMFPISSTRGDVIAFGGRVMRDAEPKYLNSSESILFKKSENLYGLNRALDSIKKNNTFYIVEGYIDVLAMHQAGVKNCVAPLGTALTENQVRLLKRYAEKGILVFDGDEAGIKATIKSVKLLENIGIESEVVELPDNADPADILQKDGISRLHNLLKCSINTFEYLIKKAFSKFDVKTPSGKEKIVGFLFEYVEEVKSQVKLDGFLNLLSEYLDVTHESIRQDFYNRAKVPAVQKELEPVKTAAPIKMTEELFILLAVAINMDYFSVFRNYISIDLLESNPARELYIALEELFREDKKSLEYLLEKLDNSMLKNLLVKKNSLDEFKSNIKRIIYDGIYSIKRKNLLKRIKKLDNDIKLCEKHEPWKMEDLLTEKMILDKEFEELKVIKDVGIRE